MEKTMAGIETGEGDEDIKEEKNNFLWAKELTEIKDCTRGPRGPKQ